MEPPLPDAEPTATPPATGAPDAPTIPTAVAPAVERTTTRRRSPLPRPDVCPFLIAESGDWRLAVPAREHRCAAFAPMTSLALDKQARLCLTAEHIGCATYLASVEAREARVGRPAVPANAGRWAFAVTTPLIEDAGGVRARVLAIVSDRRTWPAVPAVVLVATLVALGLSGAGTGQPATALASATPGAAEASPTPSPTPTRAPTPALSPAASIAPTPASSVGPSPSARLSTTYKVKSGDTLSAIATQFHTTVAVLKALNNITDVTRLHVGQILKIP